MTPSWPPSSSITRISRALIRSLMRMRSLCRKLRSAISPPQALRFCGRDAACRYQLPGTSRGGPEFITHPTQDKNGRGRASKYSTRQRLHGKRQKGDDAPRFRSIKALGAIPTPFSTCVYYHGEKMRYYGAERLNHMFAVRSFLVAGIRATQASDYPPGEFIPMMVLQSAEVTHTDTKGNIWGPNQKITVEE